ncbi:uncharacterized protein [Triticum aestivum]|uniref:uncharacterized protein n=1 Tax=Triticum aestivum TaxID=4565 RepID=UPI001D01109C|nr:uncharacterized protein LOC123067205 [Triticum aestivum]
MKKEKPRIALEGNKKKAPKAVTRSRLAEAATRSDPPTEAATTQRPYADHLALRPSFLIEFDEISAGPIQMVHQLNSFELPGSRVQSQGFLDMDVDRARGRLQSQGLGAIDADRARSRGQSQGLGDIDDDHGAVEYPRDIARGR